MSLGSSTTRSASPPGSSRSLSTSGTTRSRARCARHVSSPPRRSTRSRNQPWTGRPRSPSSVSPAAAARSHCRSSSRATRRVRLCSDRCPTTRRSARSRWSAATLRTRPASSPGCGALRPSNILPRVIGEVTFGVIGLLFLFADLRTFSSTFQLTFFGAPNTNLGVAATAVFATSFLALLVGARIGPRRAVGLSAVIFGVATLLLTASRSNWLDLALSVVALAAGLWWLALFHSSRVADAPPALARALPIAFIVDVALRAALRTQPVVDLAFPVAVGIVLVALLVFGAAGLASLSAERQWTAPNPVGTLALIAAPALVLVAEAGATNGAQVALAGGLGLGPEPARATQIGQIIVGLGLAAGLLALVRFGPNRFIGAAALAIGAAFLWWHQPVVSLVGGLILAAGLVIAAATILGAPQVPAASPAGPVVALSFGWIAFVAAAFGF